MREAYRDVIGGVGDNDDAHEYADCVGEYTT